jgi:hypothetical protein
MNCSRWVTPLLLSVCWMLIRADPVRANLFNGSAIATYTLLTPQRHQFDLSLSDGLEFVDPGSLARRDNFRKVRFADPSSPSQAARCI